MHIQQQKYSAGEGWQSIGKNEFDKSLCSLVLAFGEGSIICDKAIYDFIRTSYPHAIVLMNSTAGEILDTNVNDHSVSLTAIIFERTELNTASIAIAEVADSYEAGKILASTLDRTDLKSVLVISDGLQVNGSDLVSGLKDHLSPSIIITGGLAGDGDRFEKTLVGLNEVPITGRIAAIGFYGSALSITYGSVGGWDSFGHERLITRSEANVLYELDGLPALDIYKMYLGEYASDLPGSGLLFPLSIRTRDNNSLVRTILAVNEESKSLTFAGNMPTGSYARLMKSNFDRLIDGASQAATHSMEVKDQKPDLAILISCVGRKLVLNHRIEEEVEAVRSLYGPTTAMAGFYSYGEISPSHNFKACELHNQTMTITTFTEAVPHAE